MLESKHDIDDPTKKDKLDTPPPNDKNMMSEIQRLSKIVSELRSNDIEMKNEMAKLIGRVSQLESSTLLDEEHSTENINRKKRQISGTNTSDLRPVCSKKACAFDYGKENWQKPKIPTSCKDLLEIGHVLNGFYSIKENGKIKLVFCNFNSLKIQGFAK